MRHMSLSGPSQNGDILSFSLVLLPVSDSFVKNVRIRRPREGLSTTRFTVGLASPRPNFSPFSSLFVSFDRFAPFKRE